MKQRRSQKQKIYHFEPSVNWVESKGEKKIMQGFLSTDPVFLWGYLLNSRELGERIRPPIPYLTCYFRRLYWVSMSRLWIHVERRIMSVSFVFVCFKFGTKYREIKN